jgi:regulation of enolase protein 1 (concanavalin A-like superfamily)
MFDGMTWLNAPPHFSIDGPVLTATTGNRTDFWRETFYGFVRDDGHFLHREISGDFTAEVTIVADFDTLYDQCGLMLRVDERTWVKAGIEFTDGMTHVSAVVTRDRSDWSVVALPQYDGRLTLRLTRHGDAVRIQFRPGDGRDENRGPEQDQAWRMLRLAYLPMPETCLVGVMCCSPERAGFEVRFTDFTVGEPIPRNLHG